MSISADKQEPDDDIYDVWVEQKPVHASNMSQECVDKNAKRRHEWRGLSQKELLNLWVAGIPRMSKDRYIQIAQQVEQYLKEKNT